ncbi:hypothetical protein E2320_017365, partial [Naja naja]
MKAAKKPDQEPVASPPAPSPPLPKLLSALFYGTCSFLIVLVNKTVLTVYRFPSPMFLGVGQMITTILILYVSKLNKIIHFPDLDKSIPKKNGVKRHNLNGAFNLLQLFPLPLIYIGNHISGLSSIGKLSLPMFTVLRKFTIPLTLLLEIIILGKHFPLGIIISVFAIILGALIAAGSDLAFSLEGYVSVLLNDVFTAANGVYTKQKIDPQFFHWGFPAGHEFPAVDKCFIYLSVSSFLCAGVRDLGQIINIALFGTFSLATSMKLEQETLDNVARFKPYKPGNQVMQSFFAFNARFLLMYSTVLCSHYNSALTTAVVGAIK